MGAGGGAASRGPGRSGVPRGLLRTPAARQGASGPSRRKPSATGLAETTPLARPAATRGEVPRAASRARARAPRAGQGGGGGGGGGGRARCRRAAPPWEVLRPPQVTGIPSRRTRSFTGNRAPDRNPGAKPPSAPSCAG